MRPSKYVNVLILFALSVLAGLGAEILLALLRRRNTGCAWQGVAATVIGIALALQPVLHSARVYRGIFSLPDFKTSPEVFHHTASRRLLGKLERFRGAKPQLLALNQYYNMRRNVGTITWNGGTLLPENAIPKFVVDRRGLQHANPDYISEARCEPSASC